MLTSILAGLVIGCTYSIVAIGYNITIATAGVLNFAFANILILGAFVAIWGLEMGLPVVAVLILAAAICAAVAVVEERVAIRLLPSGGHSELVTTVGAATIMVGLTAVIWGTDPLRVPLFDQEPVSIFGGRVQPNGLIIIAAAVVVGFGLYVVGKYTRLGLASRAHATDREATMLRGVDVRLLSIGAFALTGVLAGLIGPVVAMSTGASPFIALTLAVKGFAALTIGGVGSHLGAVVGGCIIGLSEALASLYLGPNYGEFAVFAVFLVALLVRPQGILGHKSLRLV